MKRFAILPLGVGEYFSRRRYHACFILFLGDSVIAVDCPSPYRRMLANASEKSGFSLDYGDIDDIILTHLHGDHSNGLEGVGFWKYYVEKKRPRLYTSPEALEDLWAKLRGSMSWKRDDKTGEFYRGFSLEDYFDVRVWPMGSTQQLCGGTFQTHLNIHPVPTFGFKVSFDGRVFGYAGDTAFDPQYIEWLSDCDLIVHECSTPPPHTSYESLMTIDPAVRQRMRLIHYSDDFDPAKSIIKPLEEGVLVEIEKTVDRTPAAPPSAKAALDGAASALEKSRAASSTARRKIGAAVKPKVPPSWGEPGGGSARS
jgi:ribonuclease BN (tRNA processing enzyme)